APRGPLADEPRDRDAGPPVHQRAFPVRGLEVPAALMDLVVRRTKGASPAFIRELMRRSAQFQIEQGGGGRPSWARRRRSTCLRSPRKPLKSWPRIDTL